MILADYRLKVSDLLRQQRRTFYYLNRLNLNKKRCVHYGTYDVYRVVFFRSHGSCPI